jgi:hypothetical protein
MIADGSIDVKYALGIATEDIVDGDDGYVTEFGLVRGINTTGSLYGETWVDGDILYVSPTIAGGLTKVRPIAPLLHIQMAIVVYANANGSLFVRPDRFPSLGDLQTVYLNGKTNGDLLTLSGDTWTASKTLNGSYTIIGDTNIGGGLTATTISASTYNNLPSPYKTTILTGETSYTFTDFKTVNTLSVNKITSSPTTVILNQTPSVNDFYVVKDRKGDSVLNNITVSGGTYTIDGNNTVVIKSNNKPSLTFLFDGSEYIII